MPSCRRRKPVRLLLPSLAIVLWSGSAGAHPHGWIDLQVTILLDESGAVRGLRESWLFDEVYSAFATEGMDGDGDGMPDAENLQALTAVNLQQLGTWDFFTEVRAGAGSVAVPEATDATTAFAGGRLYMAFTLLFEEPVPRDAQPFSYAIFDPTYMAAMAHLPEGDGVRLEGGPPGCAVSIKDAEPDPDIVAYALSLDVTQTTDDSLGAQFAQWVTVSCRDAP
jgi:ABC-type uncharacterized transport system substrate-binding protein